MNKQIGMPCRRDVARRFGATMSGVESPVDCYYCGERGWLTWWPPRSFPTRTHYTGVLPGDWITTTHTWEHVVPIDQGGTNGPENVTIACTPCNSSKAERTLTEWIAVLRSGSQLPRRDDVLVRLGFT